MEVKIGNYQALASRTMASLGSKRVDGMHMASGVVTELGEMNVAVVNEDLVNIIEEHGDCNWYIANECNVYGLSFSDIVGKATTGDPQLFILHDYMDLHKREFAYGKEMDLVKLEWELIRLVRTLAEVCNTYKFSYQYSLHKNIQKLLKRYPNNFNSKDALNRDIEGERKILEE